MEDAIRHLRDDPQHRKLMYDSYLDVDVNAAAERFRESAEFLETWEMLRPFVGAGSVLDLGAGRGIASYAMARMGAEVVAVEPDPSDDVGAAAASSLLRGLDVPVIRAELPRLPLSGNTFAGVYVRQMLHHLSDPTAGLKEIARVMKPGAILVAAREHVVDDQRQLREFLSHHPIHQLAGGEGAFPETTYLSGFDAAGLDIQLVLGPWDSVINAFPTVCTSAELQEYPRLLMRRQFGALGIWVGHLPLARSAVWRRLNRSVPGRMFTFVARKPAG